MARNTIAIQNGYDPSTASIRFYWRETGSGSFFRDEGRTWFWPIHGIRLGNSLLLFFSIVKPAGTPGPFGFAEDGWAVFLISNPDDDPPRWRIRRLDTPVNPWRIIAGISVLVPVVLGLLPRFPVPGVVLQVVAGIIVGPSVLGWARIDPAVEVLSDLGIPAQADD